MTLWAGIYRNGKPRRSAYKKRCGNSARHKTGTKFPRGFLDGFSVVNAVGRSGGMVVAWNEAMFSRVDAWRGQFSVGVKLKRWMDTFKMVAVSAYGSANATKRKDLWRELAEVVSTFHGSPVLIGGNFHVILEARDRPNETGRQDLRSEQFWALIVDAALIEMGS